MDILTLVGRRKSNSVEIYDKNDCTTHLVFNVSQRFPEFMSICSFKFTSIQQHVQQFVSIGGLVVDVSSFVCDAGGTAQHSGFALAMDLFILVWYKKRSNSTQSTSVSGNCKHPHLQLRSIFHIYTFWYKQKQKHVIV